MSNDLVYFAIEIPIQCIRCVIFFCSGCAVPFVYYRSIPNSDKFLIFHI